MWQSASFVKETNGANALRLDIPWSAFGTPLVNIRIPTELADTFVEQPIITSTDVSAKWVATGGDYADLQGSLRIAVTLTNKAQLQVYIAASADWQQQAIYYAVIYDC